MARLGFWGKFAILFAGPLSNILLAIVLVAVMLSGQGRPSAGDSLRFLIVQPSSKAETVGFKTGDVIVAIDGKRLLPEGFDKLAPSDPKRLEQADAAAKTVILPAKPAAVAGPGSSSAGHSPRPV